MIIFKGNIENLIKINLIWITQFLVFQVQKYFKIKNEHFLLKKTRKRKEKKKGKFFSA
jgi:hypothetical protein